MRRPVMLLATSLWILLSIGQATWADQGSETLVVHEWGTFTELHSSTGVSIGGINAGDEPVSDFVHRVSANVLQSTNEPWRRLRRRFGKSVRWSSEVTTRLETPVIDFYPPAGLEKPLKVDVDVQLRGGWLSEYYPNAPGLRRNVLDRHAVGTLQWRNLSIGGDGSIPKTDQHVWLAPRQPHAATVVTPELHFLRKPPN